MIKGIISGQRLRVAHDCLAGDTIDYQEAEFSFSPEWLGLLIWAHFQNGDTIFDIPVESGVIGKDKHLNLAAGRWSVCLHGNDVNGTMRVTTNMDTILVSETGQMSEDNSPLPIPRKKN